jgi:SnoaL-like domain
VKLTFSTSRENFIITIKILDKVSIMHEQSDVNWIIQRIKIIDTIVGFANAIDNKDWQKLRSHLATTINIDYFEFRGEPPGQITAEEYIQQRVSGLTGLKTLHISTNHEVTIRENCAECKSAYRIYRLDPNRESGENLLETAGNYIHQLTQIDGYWKITAIKQTVVIIAGNPQVHGALRNL